VIDYVFKRRLESKVDDRHPSFVQPGKGTSHLDLDRHPLDWYAGHHGRGPIIVCYAEFCEMYNVAIGMHFELERVSVEVVR
jgi:hypothetical protein